MFEPECECCLTNESVVKSTHLDMELCAECVGKIGQALESIRAGEGAGDLPESMLRRLYAKAGRDFDTGRRIVGEL